MSVCFFVNQDQAGSSNVEDIDGDAGELSAAETAQQTLEQFWAKVTADIMKVSSEDFKTQALPLARIKKIMKLDDEVKMISAEAPILFAKAVEIFIHELTLRAWSHTEDNKRRTLQRNDIAMAISKSDQFDFLIDIVPRHEVKTNKPRYETVWTHAKPTTSEHARTQQPCLQQSNQQQQQHHATLQQTTQQPQIVLQPMAQVVQNSNTSSGSNNPHPVALVQSVQSHQVVSNPEMQSIPSQIQLTQAQLNMIRLQVQNNPNQPIIIQAQPQQSPQIIQVTSQGQHQQGQQVYIAQVQTSQDDS